PGASHCRRARGGGGNADVRLVDGASGPGGAAIRATYEIGWGDIMRGMKWLDEMRHDIVGIRVAFNVAIATIIVWYVIDDLANTDPIWAIASMVAASDPQVTEATRMFRSRMINVLVGCAVGLLFLIVGGPAVWKLPIALAVTVLLSTYVIHIQTMWRQ